MKAGWKTSEFWLSLIPSILAVLVVLGVISPDESQEIESGLSEVVAALFAAAGSIGAYAIARGWVKSAAVAPKDPNRNAR